MNYRNNPAINQSMLVALSKGVGSYRHQEKEEFTPDPIVIGSAVDCMLTTPDEFDSRFHISTTNFTSGAAKILKAVWDNLEHSDKSVVGINTFEHLLLEEAKIQGLGNGKWEDDRILTHLMKYADVWDELCMSNGKELISKSQLPIIDRCVNSLKNHPFTSKLINCDGEYQKELYFKHRKLACKALLDKIIINDLYTNLYISNDIVVPPMSILPIDIKTTGSSVKAFGSSFRKYRYDVQAAWYMVALKKVYESFNILPMHFIVVSTATKEHPLVYKTTWDNIFIGRYGASKEYTKVIPHKKYIEEPDILGFEQMIDLYNKHQEMPEDVRYKYDHHIYESKGIIEKDLWNEY